MIAKQLEQNPDPGMEAIIRNGLGIIYGGKLAFRFYIRRAARRMCTDTFRRFFLMSSRFGNCEYHSTDGEMRLHVPAQTVYTKEVFFLAMTLHPDIQRRAQAELDSVTGGTRLPSYEDRPNLPYINAIVKEVMRWNPVTPAGP